ncbi:hypothetical protein ANCCEY_14051, partial [Ancylostoma ceylanicum]
MIDEAAAARFPTSVIRSDKEHYKRSTRSLCSPIGQKAIGASGSDLLREITFSTPGIAPIGVENIATKKVAALKAESNDIEGGSALKLEMTVMRSITADGEKPHVPMVFHAAKHKRFCYMIMTLLGENLKELKLNCRKEYMTAKTWTR